ncbi:sulfatase-like hydrolase/transferase [Priestia megaterium]
MHPNSGMLYMRQNVYPNLGFDQVKFIDQMKHTQKDNKEFVSDEAVVDEVLDTLRQSKKPAFVHAVTIANHLPYSADKYNGQETIKVTGKGLSPEMQKEIEIYAEGIKRSDAALKRLNDEIQKLDEPTIVVFWEIICQHLDKTFKLTKKRVLETRKRSKHLKNFMRRRSYFYLITIRK